MELDLGDMKVIRSFTEKGSYLKIEAKDGAKFSNPQAVLDKLLGQFSFDPLEFAKLDAKKQRKSLLDMLGIDTEEMDNDRQTNYDSRTIINRDLKRLKTELDAVPKPEGEIPEKEIVVSELVETLDLEKTSVRKFDEAIQEAGENEVEIMRLQKRNKEIKEEFGQFKRPDIKILETKLSNAEELNGKFRTVEKRNTIIEEGRTAQAKCDEINRTIDTIDKKKKKMLDEAKMPIKSLNVTDDGVTFNDIPFDQLSSAEQLKVSVSIAMAMNPEIRIIRVMDGSLLDSDSMKVIEDLAKDKDYQVWVELVDETGEVGIVIKDGEIIKVNK